MQKKQLILFGICLSIAIIISIAIGYKYMASSSLLRINSLNGGLLARPPKCATPDEAALYLLTKLKNDGCEEAMRFLAQDRQIRICKKESQFNRPKSWDLIGRHEKPNKTTLQFNVPTDIPELTTRTISTPKSTMAPSTREVVRTYWITVEYFNDNWQVTNFYSW